MISADNTTELSVMALPGGKRAFLIKTETPLLRIFYDTDNMDIFQRIGSTKYLIRLKKTMG